MANEISTAGVTVNYALKPYGYAPETGYQRIPNIKGDARPEP